MELDFSYMMAEVIGEQGITDRRLDALREQALGTLEELRQGRRPGLAFMELAGQELSALKAEARRLRERFQDFLLLGIGGSALGPKCILEALSPLHNLHRRPRVFIYDNVDPSSLRSILEAVELQHTAVNVISKSGTTAETLASFLILYEALSKQLGSKAREHFVFITDPEKGPLRRLARELDVPALQIPPGVGGRYSVLTPVGLLLAEVIGLEAEEFLAGARAVHEACMLRELRQNPMMLTAALLYLMGREEGRPITVMVPYSDRLRAFSEWFSQLWAESLGKLGTGFTPYPSVGATDQHSQLQLWMEGPQDKVVLFIGLREHVELRIPHTLTQYEEMGYLAGHSLAELLQAEQEATELALAKAGRPSMNLTLPRLDAYHLGGLFYFFQLVTAFVGFLLGVNPFDQPSVEEGKRLTLGMMGKRGYEDKRQEVLAARKKRQCYRVVF
jgi:glucose-6-phosphate isomerase